MDSNNGDSKRTPDAILAGLQNHKPRGGRLRVFFGMCPGVGKTYAMLKAAREIKSRSAADGESHDILIGVVETHGRIETEELLEGLEKIPLKSFQHRGTEISEFDLDEALRRRPRTILIDELAHTNAPGSRHPKRYQDVAELLNAGIDVMTTINVQHIESRADLIEQMTGSKIHERVPDSFLEAADPIELIDLSPERLLKRLAEGKVYRGDTATRAIEGFFKEEHLIALRETALRFTADIVDDRLIKAMSSGGIAGPWNVGEKLLVAVSHSPYSARLIRASRRTASSLGAPWIALHVNDGTALSPEDESQLRKNLELARELGAELITTTDSDVASAIRRICNENNVTQIVMGRPDRRPLQDWLSRGTLLHRLVSETSQVDVHVIRQVRAPKTLGLFGRWLRVFGSYFGVRSTGWLAYWQTLWLMIGVGFASYPLNAWVGYRAIGYVFLLAVLLVSSLASLGPIVFAATLGAFAWNFFFIPPTFTIQITRHEDVLLTLIYFVVAVVGGTLSHRIRRQREEIVKRERRTRALFEISRHLGESRTEHEMAVAALDVVKKTIAQEAVISGPVRTGSLSILTAKTEALADWVLKNARAAGHGTDTLAGAGAYALPIQGSTKVHGVLLVPEKPSELDGEVLLRSLTQQLGLALDRALLTKENERMRMAEESERLYQTVLNSVSHELKTPLTTLIGAAGALVETEKQSTLDSQRRDPLIEDMSEAARRMQRVVENLLDISRLGQHGHVTLNTALVDFSDHVAQVLAVLKRDLRNHHVQTDFTDEALIVSLDEKLMEHAIANILANAALYSPVGSQIRISTRTDGRNAILSVKDHGPGIAEEYREKVFEKFFRIPGSRSGGTGLGLSLIKQITELHGGRVQLSSEPGAGTSIEILIPIAKGGSNG